MIGSDSRVSLILTTSLGAAVMAALLLVVTSCCLVSENKWYYATYKPEIQFVGATGENGHVEYFSVRVGSHNAQAVPVAGDFEFHWKGHKYLIRELRLDDLAGMGIGPESIISGPDGVTRAFIGGLDASNQDFGVELYFKNGSIYQFYARHSAQNGVVCP